MQNFYTLISSLLGLEASELSVWQVCMRAFVVYLVALLMVRIVGNRRFAGKYAAIDILLSITLGATLSRAINGSASFFSTLAAGFTLVGAHWLIAALAFRLPSLENCVKGSPRVLVRDGQPNDRALKKTSLTQQDLDMALRSNGNLTALEQVALAILEPSGDISVISQSSSQESSGSDSSAQVIDVVVEDHVQVVRICIDR